MMPSGYVLALTVRDGRITSCRLLGDGYAVHAAARPD